MPSKIKATIRDGYVWHTAVVAGKFYWLRKVGRVGDCLLL